MALCLSRGVGQAIIIDGKIRVVVSAIDRGRVRIAVEADEEIAVDREEIHAAKVRDGFKSVDDVARERRIEQRERNSL